MLVKKKEVVGKITESSFLNKVAEAGD